MRLLSLCIILLIPHVASASGYPDRADWFLLCVAMGFGASLLIYLVFGIVLLIFEKLYVAYMVPVFLVLMASAVITFAEVVLMQVIGTYPGSVLIGASIPTGLYLYLVKYNIRMDNEESKNNSN